MIRQREFLQELIELHRVPDRVLDRVGHIAHSPLFQQPPVDRHLPVLRRQRQHEQRFILHAGVQHGLADARRIRQAAVQRDKQPVVHPQARLGRRADDEIRHVVPEDQRAQGRAPPSAQSPATAPAETPAASAPSALRRSPRPWRSPRSTHSSASVPPRPRSSSRRRAAKVPPKLVSRAIPSPCPHASIYTRVWGKACFKVFQFILFLVKMAILPLRGRIAFAYSLKA